MARVEPAEAVRAFALELQKDLAPTYRLERVLLDVGTGRLHGQARPRWNPEELIEIEDSIVGL